MQFTELIWPPLGETTLDSPFLSGEAKTYLGSSEEEIFAEWERTFPSDKSLAGVLAKTVLQRFEKPGFAIAPDLTGGFAVKRAFHHRSSTSDLFVDIFYQFNHNDIKDCLIITQTDRFKQKFLYDSATMTVESLVRDYRRFLTALRLESRPKLFILAFDDLDFATDVLNQGKKKFLKLVRK